VLALPAIAAVCEAFAERSVVVVARRSVAPLFVGLAGVTKVIRVEGGGAARFSGMRGALAGERPALALVLPLSFGAAAEAAVTRPYQSWGYGGPLRRLALDVTLPRRWIDRRHRWEVYALLAAAATGNPVTERYPVAIGPGDVTAADHLFDEIDDGVGAVVGLVAGANASSRRWPAERYAALVSMLGREGARVVLFGSSADGLLAATIAAQSDPPPADWAGRTPLPVLAECFRRLDLLVTNDTGPMHLAAAMNTPLIDLCGAADERITGPRGKASEVIVHPIHCRPCVKNTCAYNLECMTGIPVSAVAERARARLARAGATVESRI
jgi:ADP-heptose:LPS heptosyltransferase